MDNKDLETFALIGSKCTPNTKPDAAKRVIAIITESNSDAVADVNVEEWFEDNIQQWKLECNESGQASVHVSTEVMLLRLRVAVKDGDIAHLSIYFKGEMYDCILPNGKLFGGTSPSGLFDTAEKLMFSIL